MSDERILVVDDEPGMLRTVDRVLSAQYAVTTARSAAEALDRARAAPPELAILDIRMPEVNGFELMNLLREVHPGTDVIFMTGAVQELDAQLVQAIRERAFYFIQKPFDRDVLLTLVRRCFDLRRLAAENRAHVARLEGELDEARKFQRSLLPGESARIGAVEVAARYRPCDALGGDFYDFADAGDGRAALLLADVSGHGVSAAMLTALVKSAFRDARADGYEPAAVVRRIVQALRPFDDDRFVTVFSARLDPAAGALEYVNAGHPPPLLWGPQRPREALSLTGPMISPAFPDLSWDQARRELGPGHRLLAYTDGLVEARGAAGLFGEERLQALLDGSAGAGGELLDAILSAASAFAAGRPSEDDCTLLTTSPAR